MNSVNNDIPSQTLRRDAQQKNLYFFYKDEKFSVLQNVSADGHENMLQFGGFSAKTVSDFRPIGTDKFIILTKNGHLHYYEFSTNHIKKLAELSLNYGEENLEFCTFNVCPKDKYLVVSVGDKLTSEKKDLFLLEIQATEKLKMIDRKKFEGEGKNSVYFRMNIQYVDEKTPVVTCFEKGNEFKMVMYVIEDEQLNQFEKIRGYHNAPFLTVFGEGGEVVTMDVEGCLYSLPLKEGGRVMQGESGGEEQKKSGTDLGVYSGGVVSFERQKVENGGREERGGLELKSLIEEERIRLANCYNNRRSMVIDYTFRKEMLKRFSDFDGGDYR